MVVKIIWILLGLDALMFLGLLIMALTSHSDAAGNGMAHGMAVFAGIVLVVAALPILFSHHPISLISSGILASLPLLGILVFWVSTFFPSQPQQYVSLADYNFSNKQQRAIANAIENADTVLLQAFIKEQDLNVRGKEGLNYLQFAIRLVNSEADEARIQEPVRLLMKAGADPNQGLAEAVYYLSPATLALFLDGGANPNLKDFTNQPIIFRCLSAYKPKNAELLVRKGADPNALDEAGYSLTMRAAVGNFWPTVRYLLENAQTDYSYVAPDGQSLLTIVRTIQQQRKDSTNEVSPDLLAVCEWLEKKETPTEATE